MRYGLEVAGVNTVMANDMSEVAVKIIDKNVKLNNLTKIVVSRRFDAM
jgi:N2,N2-dimethylguanosine tRNA methyltransferase